MNNRQIKKEIKHVENIISSNQKILREAKIDIHKKLYYLENKYWYVLPTVGFVLGWMFYKKSFITRGLFALGKIHLMDLMEHRIKRALTIEDETQ